MSFLSTRAALGDACSKVTQINGAKNKYAESVEGLDSTRCAVALATDNLSDWREVASHFDSLIVGTYIYGPAEVGLGEPKQRLESISLCSTSENLSFGCSTQSFHTCSEAHAGDHSNLIRRFCASPLKP